MNGCDDVVGDVGGVYVCIDSGGVVWGGCGYDG